VFEFALHFRPDDPAQWIVIDLITGAMAALFLFLWLRKGSVVDFLDPQTLRTPSERAMDAFTETMAVSGKSGRIAHALIWGFFGFLSGAAATLIVSMTVLGAILGTGTAAELGVGSLVAIGLALATWFFIFALRGELRCDPARAGWAKRRTKAKE
jgi:hypothetical protein